MVQINHDHSAPLCSRILHVRICDSQTHASLPADEAQILTLSHDAFRNEGLSAYESPALAAIRESGASWIFLEWWTGAWTEPAFRAQLETLIREQPDIHCAQFDEVLAGDGSFAFADSGIVSDHFGNIPSCILIRRDALGALLPQVRTLFPYPVAKLAAAARQNGTAITICHTPAARQVPIADCLMAPGPVSAAASRGKKLLVLTHELGWTGAPIVLSEACIDVLKGAGYEILVVSPTPGPLARRFLENGISVMVLPEVIRPGSRALYQLAQAYDAVLVNTLVPYESVRLLNMLKKPVLWWIHECALIYQWVGDALPRQLEDRIHIRCVGQYALNVLHKYRPEYAAQSLIYGLQDQNPAKASRSHQPGTPFRFATIGSIEDRKGQDILCRAIGLLDGEIRAQCQFVLAGNALSPEILSQLEDLKQTYPDLIRYLGLVPRDVLSDVYPEVDCILCPSRDDPMPTYVTEGLMYGKPAICSENTGSAPIVLAEHAGFVYSDNDPCQLAQAITRFVTLSDGQRNTLAENARACFEKHYSLDVFRNNLLQTMEALLPARAEKTNSPD